MKRKRFYLCAFAVLLVICSISIWTNVSRAAEQERIGKVMINDAYFKFNRISNRLNDILLVADTPASDYTTIERSLTDLALDFMQLHTALKYYAISFQPKGVARNSYAGIYDFEDIAYTLITGTGSVNANTYSGILEDGAVSEDEAQYLTILKNDIDAIIESMTSSENSLQENSELTTTQIDYILNSFFDKWSWHEEDSPFFLLCK